jgi:hypothetical protein
MNKETMANARMPAIEKRAAQNPFSQTGAMRRINLLSFAPILVAENGDDSKWNSRSAVKSSEVL